MSSPPVRPAAARPGDQQDRRPVVVADDPATIDDLVRLAAAAGVTVEVYPDLTSARAGWAGAPLVLVDSAAVAAASRASVVAVPRRESGVVLVGRDPDDSDLWRHGVVIGAEHVVLLPEAEPWLVNTLGDTLGRRPGRAEVIAVVGGSGGAGASTLAASLAAVAAQQGTDTVLLDLDPVGGGIDLLLGSEAVSGLRWQHLAQATGRLNGRGLRDALPTSDGLRVLAWDRSDHTEVGDDAVRAVVDSTVKTFELVVVDLPRSATDGTAYACSRATDLVAVVPSRVRAVVAAQHALWRYRALAARSGVVVAGAPSDGLRPAEVGDALGLPVLGELRCEPGIAVAADRGESPVRRRRGTLFELCRELLVVCGAEPSRSGAAGGGR